MRDLGGKRVLITGGAQGIGRAIAERFGAEGATLLLTDIDEAALSDTAAEFSGRGCPVHTYRSDVAERDAMPALRDRIHADCGPIDVLVNNAGVVFGGPFLEVPLERHLRTYEINTLGLVAMTWTFLPDLISRPEAHIVNVSSAAGFIGLPYGTTYASSKWSVTGFSESLRLELNQMGHRHVGVTAVCPSYVSTGLFDGVAPPKTTRMVRPERLARLTVSAVRRNRAAVLTPWLVRMTPILKGILPRPVFESISDLLGATSSMRSWRGHSS